MRRPPGAAVDGHAAVGELRGHLIGSHGLVAGHRHPHVHAHVGAVAGGDQPAHAGQGGAPDGLAHGTPRGLGGVLPHEIHPEPHLEEDREGRPSLRRLRRRRRPAGRPAACAAPRTRRRPIAPSTAIVPEDPLLAALLLGLRLLHQAGHGLLQVLDAGLDAPVELAVRRRGCERPCWACSSGSRPVTSRPVANALRIASCSSGSFIAFWTMGRTVSTSAVALPAAAAPALLVRCLIMSPPCRSFCPFDPFGRRASTRRFASRRSTRRTNR